MAWEEVKPELAPTWKPEKEGDEIKGVLIDKQVDVGKNKSKLYSIEDAEGNEIAVWGSSRLDTLLKGVAVGDKIQIRFIGWAKSKSGRDYKDYKVFVDKE